MDREPATLALRTGGTLYAFRSNDEDRVIERIANRAKARHNQPLPRQFIYGERDRLPV
ncbi:hypothetical protein [Paraburkholderia lycopersici]|uniref:Uncharacterized protein n=1 Tax=Paraburkholderia lycopersici TaxID=416944 RepID=A0A1G7DJV2_9BURK|nr:hypothetical protein [Paraburkholderia lycopersici]SDE51035.1 hypothetical protein SAMN05421548_1622 [Paraburkholderia lycopersici]